MDAAAELANPPAARLRPKFSAYTSRGLSSHALGAAFIRRSGSCLHRFRSFERLVAAAKGAARILTLAPELPGAPN